MGRLYQFSCNWYRGTTHYRRFNFHLDNVNDRSSQKFLSTLSEYGLTQHVKTSTHVSSHILDVVITRDCTNILKIPPKVNDTFICDSKGVSYSDHKGINTVLCISKPPKQRKTVTSRNFKNMNIDNFKNDLNYPSENVLRTSPVNDLVNIYNDCVRDAIDKHAPIRTKEFILRPNTQWYSTELLQTKREKRKPERTWRLSRLEVNKQMFMISVYGTALYLRKTKKNTSPLKS